MCTTEGYQGQFLLKAELQFCVQWLTVLVVEPQIAGLGCFLKGVGRATNINRTRTSYSRRGRDLRRKKSQCNCFFRAVFEARNVINAGAITASDASQLWFVVGLRSVSSEECQLWANVVKNGG